MARTTKEARAYAKARTVQKEAARRWTALAFLLAGGERITFPQVKRLAQAVAKADATLVETGVALSRRQARRRA